MGQPCNWPRDHWRYAVQAATKGKPGLNEQTESVPDVDVCIVGAGPAGLAAAMALGEAGRTVRLIESGGLTVSQLASELTDGENVGEPYVGLAATRRRQAGGTTNIWNVEVGGERSAKYVPLSPRDIVEWPIEWDELRSHYIAAQQICGLGPFEYGADYWESTSRQAFDLSQTALQNGIYQFGAADRFIVDAISRIAALGNVTFAHSTTVVGLVESHGRGSPGRIAGVQSVDPTGRPQQVKARRVVLACGAVENARLLLLAGWGEESPWLGRGFMEHARDFSLALQPNAPEIFAQATFYDAHTAEGGLTIGGRIGVAEHVLQDSDIPNAAMTLFPRRRPLRRRNLLRRAKRLLARPTHGQGQGPYGWSGEDSPGSGFDDFKVILNVEQRPSFENRIELGDTADRYGNLLPRLEFHWTDEDQAGLDQLRHLIADSFKRAGIGRLSYTEGSRPDLSAHHHAGTTRMAADPSDGVVDANCRAFGIANLHVAGASVFPTAGFANPTLTIVAMAVRLANHIDSELG